MYDFVGHFSRNDDDVMLAAKDFFKRCVSRETQVGGGAVIPKVESVNMM